ncbi:MAG: hypothetical protein Q8P41_09435 [Pseudomonadota bacterium]|nr:hypothetical protein [Pseudomonadota bacterium]
MLLLLSSVALAGWTRTAEENGCVYFVGDRQGTYAPVRAECEWPIAAGKLQGILAANGAHADYFTSVSASRVLGPTAGGELVYQVHEASGISDREIVLVMGQEAIPGGTRYTWTRAADQAKVTGKLVPTVVDTGKWEVTATATGAKVVYELLYDPGGSVPSFLVRSFQGSGTRTLVGELRTWAEAH